MREAIRVVGAGAGLALLVLLVAVGIANWGNVSWQQEGAARGGRIDGWEQREVWFANGASIAFSFRLGHGPPVLLLHGWPGSSAQGRVFAEELFPAVRKKLEEKPPAGTPLAPLLPSGSSEQLTDKKLLPYTFVIVDRPAPAIDSPLTPEEQEADLYALLLDELDITKVAVMSLPGAHRAAATFMERHGDKCWAVVQVAADAVRFDNCFLSSFSVLCTWAPPFLRSFIARGAAFFLPRFAANEQAEALLPCLSVPGSDRASRMLQARLVATSVGCTDTLTTPTTTGPNDTSTGSNAVGLDTPWLQVVGTREPGKVREGPTGAATVETVPGLVGERMIFPGQTGPLIEKFLERATQFLVW